MKTDPATRLIAKNRRAKLKAEGLCLNGAMHGKSTHGVLCKQCRERHRRSA